MIHRAVLGSLERFFAMLVEYYAGKFPLWLNPVQVKFLPIADRHLDKVNQYAEMLNLVGVRFEIDDSSSTLKKKIRNAELEHVNYILVVGDKEAETNSVNVRTRDNKVHGTKEISLFLKEIIEAIRSRQS